MSSFIEILKHAVLSPDNQTRETNEARLIEYRQKEPKQFLVDCINHLSDDVTDASLKQAIATLIGLSFSSELTPGEGIWWYKIDKNIREEIKNICLQNLIHKNDIIKNAIANLISTIYVLDVPNKEWSTLVSSLSTNTTHANVDIQRSAVLTLGYICEKLATNSITPSSEDVESIMAGVANCLVDDQKNEEIRLTAIKALQDSIPLFKEELQKETTRDFFLTLILKNAGHSNEEIVLKAVQSLIDIFKSCYKFLNQRYMDVISDSTIALMKKNVPSIVIATTEFWDSVARYEVKLLERQKTESGVIVHKIIAAYGVKITQALLENLLKKDNGDDDSGLSVHAVTLECLTHVNNLAFETNQNLNLEFIGTQIGGESERSKVAALLCFEAMILGYDQDISHLVDSSFSNIVEFLKVNAVVCKAALKVITAISDRYPGYLILNNVVSVWLEILNKIMHSDITFAPAVCAILSNLGNYLFKKDTQCEFQGKLVDIIKSIAEVCFTKGTSANQYIISDCFIAIMNLSKGLPNIASHNAFIDFSHKCILNTHNLHPEVKTAIRDGLLVAIMTSVYILKRMGATVKDVDQQAIGALYEFCLQECRGNKDSFPNALTVIVAISSLLRSEFDASKVQEICSLASSALRNSNNEDLMRAGLGSVGDLVRSFPEAMAPHVPGLLDYMMESLQSTNTSKDLRVCIISTTGDIAIGCPKEIKSRLQNILHIFLFAFEAVIHLLNNENDSASLDYADNMRTTLAESLHYITHELLEVPQLKDSSVDTQLGNFLPMLLLFIAKNLEQEKKRPSDFFIISTLLCLHTMAKHRIANIDKIDRAFLQKYVPWLAHNSPRKDNILEAFRNLSTYRGIN